MLHGKKTLFIPGPTPVADSLQRASMRPMINHRGPEFHELFSKVTQSLKELFFTQGKIFIITGSGTSSLEAAMTNSISPGDKVLVLVGGSFGERWVKLASTFGAQVEILEYPWGQGVDPEQVGQRLAQDPDIKAVFTTQNESSTGVANDIKAIAQAKGDHPALLVVDAVSSFGAMELKMDEWGVDVVATASQKCLMMAPGLAFVTLSPRAWEVAQQAKAHRFYFDLRSYDQFDQINETPFTPNVNLCFALEEAVEMLKSEGLDHAIKRHFLMRDMVRGGLSALGLQMYVKNDDHASSTVTAVMGAPGLDLKKFRQIAEEEFGCVLATGQGKVKDTTFRIGHMGYMMPVDMIGLIGIMEMALKKAGLDISLGQGVKKAQEILLERQ